eukprot:12449721-Alexandrium_andersonii.AAC.1
MALSEAMEMAELVRAYYIEFRQAKRIEVQSDYAEELEIMGITDCRDLFDSVTGDIQALREYRIVQYRWVATTQQLADKLTKQGVD